MAQHRAEERPDITIMRVVKLVIAVSITAVLAVSALMFSVMLVAATVLAIKGG